MLNGITSENDIEAVYPGHCLWSVAIGMDATRVGRSLTFGAEGRIQFGEKGGEMTDRCKSGGRIPHRLRHRQRALQ